MGQAYERVYSFATFFGGPLYGPTVYVTLHATLKALYSSVAEPEPHGATSFYGAGAGAVTRCGSGSDGSGSDSGIKHGKESKNDTKCNSL
jgi:hypothetical protein